LAHSRAKGWPPCRIGGTIAESLTVPACTVKATAYRRRLQVTVNDVETSAISSKRPRAVRSGTTSHAFLRICKG
jgi:hypothetical protein